MSELFHIILYQPIFNLLVFLYNIVPGHDIGIAIILLTIIIKLIFFPLSAKSIKSQKALQALQPKMEEIKKKYKDQKEKMSQAMMHLYKQEKVNPFSSCLPLLIQLPFLIAVFQVFRNGFGSETLDILYPFIHNPGEINAVTFGILDLGNSSPVLAVLAGAAQFWQAKMMVSKKQPQVTGAKDENMMAMMNKQMLYLMPVITVIIGFNLPGGLTLYWFVTTLLMALQQLYIFKKPQEEIVRVS